MKKRSYASETRDAGAAKTKSSILKSAKQLFQNDGFDSVTINKIAEAAGVSMPTIYALFKSKRGVLQALIDEALPPDQHATLVDTSLQEKTPEKRLRTTARLSRELYDAERELIDIIRDASVVATEFKELEQEREKRRYERQSEYVKKLQEEGFLAKGLPLKQARDILWALTGRDMYRMLVIEQGWASDAYERWLADTLIKALI